MNTPLIREASVHDLPVIVKLCAEHASFEKAHYTSNGKLEKLEELLFCERPRLHCLVAQVGDEVIGYATFADEISTWTAGSYIHVDCLFVQAPFRGVGIGEKLMREIRRHAADRNLAMQWQTPSFNERAIRFYLRLGAERKEKIRFYLAPNERLV